MTSSVQRGLRRTVAPTFLPVDVAGLKRQAGINVNDDNELLQEYVEAAADFAENYQERCLRQSTWQAVYDGFPSCGVFYVPKPRLVSVSFVKYLDAAGTLTTLATSCYTTDIISEPGRIALKYGQVWPTTLDQIASVTVEFVAGYASAAAIPARTRQAIRALASHWYECREPVVVGESVANVPLSVTDLLNEDKFLSYR